MQQRDPRSYNTWRVALEDGRIKPIEALLRWTFVASARRVMDLDEYTQLVVKTLPEVEWLQPGSEFEVMGYMPVSWTCASEFFDWADSYLGHVFSLGSFLREYIAEHEPVEREKLLKAKEVQIAEKLKEARENPLPAADQGTAPRNPAGRKGRETDNNIIRPRQGTDQTYTLRRLARDKPELLDH